MNLFTTNIYPKRADSNLRSKTNHSTKYEDKHSDNSHSITSINANHTRSWRKPGEVFEVRGEIYVQYTAASTFFPVKTTWKTPSVCVAYIPETFHLRPLISAFGGKTRRESWMAKESESESGVHFLPVLGAASRFSSPPGRRRALEGQPQKHVCLPGWHAVCCGRGCLVDRRMT